MASAPVPDPENQTEGEAIKPAPPIFRPPEPERVSISSSESFEFEDVRGFLAKRAAVVVTLLGDRDSGKSTLICSIYDRFLHGPFANQRSTGALTITGFEQRAHLERLESGRTTPDTQHTSLGEGLRYFHLGMSPELQIEESSAILISDRAGETYKNARGNPALVSSLVELPIADYLVVLIDGKRLADLTTRAGALFPVRQTLQMLADHQPSDANYQVQVVLTKVDLIEAATDAVDLRVAFDEFEARLRDAFTSRFASLTFFEIAARPLVGDYAAAYGVDALIKSWLVGPKKRLGVTATPLPARTEFDLLADRPVAQESSE